MRAAIVSCDRVVTKVRFTYSAPGKMRCAMQGTLYDVAIWLRWPAGLLACSELPRYVEEVEACSHFDAAQLVMQQYGVERAAHVAVASGGVVKRWSFLRLVHDTEET